MSGGSLQVKAVLLKEGVENGAKEIRRFRVELEENQNGGPRRLLQSLVARIHSVFNVNPTDQECNLSWKDEDGDLVQFSSEEELSYAVSHMADETLRIFVTISGKGKEGLHPEYPTTSSGEKESYIPGFSFHIPPPPPPPPPFHGPPPPPPFASHWAHHGGWKKWKPMGAGGWKGGWKGGLYYGCPWTQGRDGYRFGWGCKGGRGFFKHGWGKKKMTKRMMNTMRWNVMGGSQQNELVEVRKQVPAEFRDWVRQYVRNWHAQGPEAVQSPPTDKLPEGVGQDFPQWLLAFLNQHYSGFRSSAEWNEEMWELGKDGEAGSSASPPDCLPAVYYRWLCLFLPHFFWRQAHLKFGAACDCEEDEDMQYPGCSSYTYNQGCHPKKGKHGTCKGKKGGKHRRCSSSSESEDSDGGRKAWRQVPKGLRKFVRVSFKHLRKGKANSAKIQAKATRAGVSKEVQEFVQQVILEWVAKRTRLPPRAIAMEMMEGERTLPAGMQREHFLWMVRFMARWDGGAGIWGGLLPGWLSVGGDSASDDNNEDDVSGEGAARGGQGCGPCPPTNPPGMPGQPFFMPGAQGFTLYPRVNTFAPPPPPPYPYPYPPPPPSMFGCYPPSAPPAFFPPPPAYVVECPGEENSKVKGCKDDRSDSDSSSSSSWSLTDDMVDNVTEGVKKM